MAGNSLIARLGLDSSSFTGGLRKTEGRVKGFGNKISSVFTGQIQGAIAGLVASFTLGAAINQFKRLTNEFDRLGKTSEKLGLTVEGLQKLRFAASQTGVETKSLDVGFQRFTRRLSEAQNGTGEAVGALKELGVEINTSDGRARKAEEVFYDLADAFKGVTNQGDRVRLAFKLFDTEGVALVNTLQGGREALEGFGKELEETGLITTSQTEAAATYRDAIDKLGKLITAQVAPAVTDLALVMTDLINGQELGTAKTKLYEERMAKFEQEARKARDAAKALADVKLGGQLADDIKNYEKNIEDAWKLFKTLSEGATQDEVNNQLKIFQEVRKVNQERIAGIKSRPELLSFYDEQKKKEQEIQDIQKSGQAIIDKVAAQIKNEQLPAKEKLKKVEEEIADVQKKLFSGGIGSDVAEKELLALEKKKQALQKSISSDESSQAEIAKSEGLANAEELAQKQKELDEKAHQERLDQIEAEKQAKFEAIDAELNKQKSALDKAASGSERFGQFLKEGGFSKEERTFARSSGFKKYQQDGESRTDTLKRIKQEQLDRQAAEAKAAVSGSPQSQAAVTAAATVVTQQEAQAAMSEKGKAAASEEGKGKKSEQDSLEVLQEIRDADTAMAEILEQLKAGLS